MILHRKEKDRNELTWITLPCRFCVFLYSLFGKVTKYESLLTTDKTIFCQNVNF